MTVHLQISLYKRWAVIIYTHGFNGSLSVHAIGNTIWSKIIIILKHLKLKFISWPTVQLVWADHTAMTDVIVQLNELVWADHTAMTDAYSATKWISLSRSYSNDRCNSIIISYLVFFHPSYIHMEVLLTAIIPNKFRHYLREWKLIINN